MRASASAHYEFQCRKCTGTFSAVNHSKGNRRIICDSCRPAARREWERAYVKSDAGREKVNRAKSKYNGTEAARSAYYKYTYGISRDDYMGMLEKQGGVCAVCQEPETSVFNGKTRRLSVDHCHTTGAVRGLLCLACNAALGNAKDSCERLLKLAAYLNAAQVQDNS